mmetsp:Transcript_10957/g.38527  ORF Transcript_10957/g.38527 Transcript_10957/m.38527 type:complete len:237 (+) Transcript_10957:1829-2539(+)
MDVLPGPAADRSNLDVAPRELRDRGEHRPLHLHAALRLVDEDPRLLRSIRNRRQLLVTDAGGLADARLHAPSSADKESDHRLVLDAVLQAAGRDLRLGRRHRRATAEVPVVVPDAPQLDHRRLGPDREEPPDFHLALPERLHDRDLRARALVQHKLHATRVGQRVGHGVAGNGVLAKALCVSAAHRGNILDAIRGAVDVALGSAGPEGRPPGRYQLAVGGIHQQSQACGDLRYLNL